MPAGITRVQRASSSPGSRTDADCLDYLEWLRWPDGFACPACGGSGWQLGDGRFECAGCGRRTSVTAGTIFDRTRTPLTVWFTACWLFATQKDGVSAQSLQRALDIGSYQTAWAMLRRLRSVLVRPGRDLLVGRWKWMRRSSGARSLDCAAAGRGARNRWSASRRRSGNRRVSAGAGWRSCRTRRLPRCARSSLATSRRAPGARVLTDAWQGYHGLDSLGYTHERRSQRAARTRGEDPDRGYRAAKVEARSFRMVGPSRRWRWWSRSCRRAGRRPVPGAVSVLAGHD